MRRSEQAPHISREMEAKQASNSLIRIYGDFNDTWGENSFTLHCRGSLEDLQRYADQLKEGMKVILYQTGELEAEAVLQRPETGDFWIGLIDPQTIKYYDE